MATDYALLFLEGEKAGQAYPLTKDEVTLGRSRSNDLTFNDQLLSRQHLLFHREGEEIMLEDPGSTHGAFLNEKRLRGILSLNEGDVLQAGSQKMRMVKLEEVADLVEEPVAELEAIDQAAAEAAEAEAADELDKTSFGDVEDAQETRYHAVGDVRYDEDEDDHTRVLQDQSTRMLDVDELQGLKATQPARTSSRKVAVGVLVLVLLAAGAGFLVWKSVIADKQVSSAKMTYSDDQHAFRLRYPGTWLKSSTYADALIGFELVEDKKPAAHLKVYIDTSRTYPLQGLTVGFEAHQATLQERYPNFKLKGKKLLDVNQVRVIQYGFTSDSMEGLGLFTINGLTRFDIEAAATREKYPDLKDDFVGLLGSFKLDGRQAYIDYPLPDEATRHLALSDPAELTRLAREQMNLARDLLARRQVRQENLYQSVRHYQGAMRKATALSTRPPFYEQAAAGLGEAIEELARSVDDLKFSITMAEKTRDMETIRWDLAQLVQMVPDKNDPVYRYAQEKMRKYRLQK